MIVSSCVVKNPALEERDKEDRRQEEEDKLRRIVLRDTKKITKLQAEVKVAEQSSDSSYAESVEDVEELPLIPPFESNYRDYLAEVWNSFNPPITEEEIIYKYVGVVYRDKKKQQHLSVGKVTRRFLHEKDSAAAALEVECLKKKHGATDNILEVVPSHLNKD